MDTYEKKYKNALELAKDYFKANQRLGELEENDMLSDIFPELKKSEDERVRKAIVATIHLYYGEPLEDEAKEMIAWLEKQSEQILANSAKTCKDEQKPTDEEMKTLLRTEYEKGRADAIAEMQNPAWSEEDEEELDIAISTLKEAGQHDSAKWLKSLKDKVQPKWSEDDARLLDNCISLIEDIPCTEEEQNWLKSLRPQSQWKPSDEQMKALHDMNLIGNISYAGQGKVLIELYNDLKRLLKI